MLNSVNNISFKSIRLEKQSQFTELQKNIAKDIQSKLGKVGEEKDFIIVPLENDVVEQKCRVGSVKQIRYERK